MKQLALQGVTPFAPSPELAPDDVVTACNCEADAVAWSIEYAKQSRGLSLRTLAKACGWRSASYLSEIASPENEKTMPEKRVARFVLATGIRLLEQFYDRQETLRRLRGNQTQNDRAKSAVAAMLRAA